MELIIIAALLILVILIAIANIKVVPQANAYVLNAWAHTAAHGVPACTLKFLSSTKSPSGFPERTGHRLPAAAGYYER